MRWGKLDIARLVACCLSVMAFTALGAGSASASSGQITRAFTSSDWTRGSIAGWATSTECGAGCAYWVAVATVEPAQLMDPCRPGAWASSDRSIQTIWSSGAQPNGATASFDFADIPILEGVVGQRVCLSITNLFPNGNYSMSNTVAQRDLAIPVPEIDPATIALKRACEEAAQKIARLQERRRKALKAGKARYARELARTLKTLRSEYAASC